MRPLRFLKIVVLTGTILVSGSCNSGEAGNTGEVDADRIFLDYHFTAYEEGGDIALKLQYRAGGPQGSALLLAPPAGVTVDGQPVPVDSSGIDGAFYELVKPFSDFSGSHVIVYTDANGKKLEETVEFPPLDLAGVLPDTLDRSGIEVPLAGLGKGDLVQVLLTDTSAYSPGIERTDSLRDGVLRISEQELSRIKSGPVNFQLLRHRIRPLSNPTAAGGKLTVTYAIAREVFIR
ncbi:MAG: hypothetical protein EOO09_03470 [Chitinophagaceae bacterium]|nr:MAG: hypothetical protein EOO09_03470 [Chitinophagaceae bacterium]